ncbi:11552_t:CDS:2, partial [Acaulospora morrowiae]
ADLSPHNGSFRHQNNHGNGQNDSPIERLTYAHVRGIQGKHSSAPVCMFDRDAERKMARVYHTKNNSNRMFRVPKNSEKKNSGNNDVIGIRGLSAVGNRYENNITALMQTGSKVHREISKVKDDAQIGSGI